MKFIGITGGVGAGKSQLLHYIEKNYNAKVVLADKLAHELMQPGCPCYEKIISTFGAYDIFASDGTFDSKKMAQIIFSDAEKRKVINSIVHPEVKKEILHIADDLRAHGEAAYFILEAALLIEDGYDRICDELWYINTSKENRRLRLKTSRGYSDEKIEALFGSQLPEETYLKYCRVVIDNNGTLEETFRQIDRAFAIKQTVG